MPQLQFFGGVDSKVGRRSASFATTVQSSSRMAGDDGEKVIQDEIDKRGWRQYMADPNFRFTPVLRSWSRQIAKKVRGSDPDDLFQDLYMSLALVPTGGIWKFNPAAQKVLEGFWNYIVKNRAMSFQRDEMGERTRLPTTPITDKEEGDTGPGIGEGTLPGKSDNPAQHASLTSLLAEFRDWLRTARKEVAPQLLKLWGAIEQQIQEDPDNPLRQKDMAELTGMSTGQISHYMGILIEELQGYAEDEPDLQPFVQRMVQERAAPVAKEKGPREGIYAPPGGGSPVEIILARDGVKSVSVRRKDGQPWEGGAANKNVPKEQVQLR